VKALTVRQPWAAAIAYGDKRVENRTWKAPGLGRVVIHAGKAADWDAPGMAWTAAGLAPYGPGCTRSMWAGSLALGEIVAVAEVTGCHDWTRCRSPDGTLCSPWAARGQWHWVLGSVRPLAVPAPCKGALGLWAVPPEAEAAVLAQLIEES
jgi:ASCH domain